MTYEMNKAHLMNLLDDLFGDIKSEEQFIKAQQIIGELESWMVEDERLTWSQIIEIEEIWGSKAA